MKTNITRFSNRVEDYVKYRPQYPAKVIQVLEKEMGLTKDFVVADIGSGTGISSINFLNNGNKVYAVEPNKEMREAAESAFSGVPNFISVNGTAEETTLENKSIDLVFSGQAFHWFDKEKTKAEFDRILKPGGSVVLVWNVRNETTDFQKAYEQMLRDTIPEYKGVTHKNIPENAIKDFFFPQVLQRKSIDNSQEFDLEQLTGRLRSSSYSPKEGPEYEKVMKKVEEIFNKFQQNGKIKFEYSTDIYWAK